MKQRSIKNTCFWTAATVALMFVVCGGLVFLPGCGSSDTSDSSLASEEDERFQEEYFQYAMENLQRIEQFGGGEMRQQIVDRLNQWIPSQDLPSNWEADPMLEPLSLDLDLKKLGGQHFSPEDGYALQQAVWMRDLAKWTCGDSNDPVERGAKLFDWIVRNIQLQKTAKDGFGKIPKQPWETLFFGRGTAVDRAWVFVLAARQQAIDAVVLMVPTKEDPQKLTPWAIGVLKDEELYLFDPELGLPIPAKDGVSIEGMQLVVKPATLSEVVSDPSILRQLDLSETETYFISAEQIQKAVAMIVASEDALSARFALVESRMAGKYRAILTVQPSAIAKDLMKVKGLGKDSVQLWDRPFVVNKVRAELGQEEKALFERAMRPFFAGNGTPLWKGRAAHIMGKLTGAKSATFYYQKARPSNLKLLEYQEQFTGGHPEKNPQGAEMFQAFVRAKQDASYWLGLVNYSLDDQTAAIDYFLNRTLQKSINGPWFPGAIYNLGRSLERVGQFAEAAKVLRANRTLVNVYGNTLRANWLSPETKPVPEKPVETPAAEKPEPTAEKPKEGSNQE